MLDLASSTGGRRVKCLTAGLRLRIVHVGTISGNLAICDKGVHARPRERRERVGVNLRLNAYGALGRRDIRQYQSRL